MPRAVAAHYGSFIYGRTTDERITLARLVIVTTPPPSFRHVIVTATPRHITGYAAIRRFVTICRREDIA